DDENLLEPGGEVLGAVRLERPAQADLVEADAETLRLGIVDAEIVERLADVEIGLAGRGDAEPRLGRVEDDAVEPVDSCEGEDGVHLRPVQPALLIERRVGPADVEAV